MTNITEIETHEIGNESLQTIFNLMKSEQVTSHTFVRPLTDGGGELTECLISEKLGDDNHFLVSTYGAGGLETDAVLNVNKTNEEGEGSVTSLPFHAEFFMLADSEPTAKVFAEELANISFTVSESGKGLVPGMVISGINGADDVFYLFNTNPLGVHSDYSPKLIITPDFVLGFLAVTRLYESEAKLVGETEDGLQKLQTFLESLGADAYKIGRPKFE